MGGTDGLVNIVFLVLTAGIAWHGLTYRNAEGGKDWVRLFFACIAMIFFLRVLFVDVMGVPLFGVPPKAPPS